MGSLQGKVAVVTGAAKGIGAAVARTLAAEGASVVVNYVTSAAEAEAVASAIVARDGKARAIRGDVSVAADVEALFAEAEAAFGRVDVLVNNAGVFRFVDLADIGEDHFRAHFDTNVLGVLLASRAAATAMGEQGGSIVNVSSVMSLTAPAGTAVYSASKAAVDAVTSSLAKELGPRRIRVNAVNPGPMRTEGTPVAAVVGPDFDRVIGGRPPLGRIGTPEDVASVVAFLASDAARWITGEILVASGGFR